MPSTPRPGSPTIEEPSSSEVPGPARGWCPGTLIGDGCGESAAPQVEGVGGCSALEVSTSGDARNA